MEDPHCLREVPIVILELEYWKDVMEDAELSDVTVETLAYGGKIVA